MDAAGAVAPVVLTSEKLISLNVAYAAAWQAMIKITDPLSKDAKDAKLAVWKAEGEIKAEEATIQKGINDAKVAEMRNQRLALNQNQLDAHTNYLKILGTKGAKSDDLEAAQLAFNTAKELVDNELLAKYAASKSAKTAVATDGEVKDATDNQAAILELARAGKDHKEIEAEGYKRSTVWHTINNAKKAGETFPGIK